MFIASTDMDICSVLLPSLPCPLQRPVPTHVYQ